MRFGDRFDRGPQRMRRDLSAEQRLLEPVERLRRVPGPEQVVVESLKAQDRLEVLDRLRVADRRQLRPPAGCASVSSRLRDG
jgi:hypothetical protein